jgi:gluconolactonase
VVSYFVPKDCQAISHKERYNRSVIVPKAARVEKLATGFGFTEGPVWTRQGELLFSDIPNNVIFRWTQADAISEFRKPSGYDGTPAYSS